MMKVDLNGKTAIITGGSGGIGSAIGRALIANGAFVYICDINDEKGAEVVAEMNADGEKARFLHCDVTSEDDCRTVVEAAVKERGYVDFMFNNAGANIVIERRGKIRNYEAEAWDFTVNACLDGLYHFSKYVVPVMKEKGGAIVNTGSVTGFRMGLRNQAAYNMSKAAIHSLTRAEAIEYAKYGITVNSIIPGTTWHEAFYKSLATSEEMKQKFLSHVPLGEPNTPDDMAAAALFFVSPEGRRVTGVLLNVDGGWASGYCKG